MEHVFNRLGRQISKKRPGGETEQLTYDGLGRVEWYINALGAGRKYVYGADGRLSAEEWHRDYASSGSTSPERRVTYAHNLRGSVTETVDGDVTQNSEYDFLGHVLKATTDYGVFAKSVEYGYQPNGRMKHQLAVDGTAYDYAWDVG